MPGKTVQIRGGLDSAVDSFIGAARELVCTTDSMVLRLNDGSTAGGVEMARNGYLSISVAGSSDTTLTASQSQPLINCTGTLTGNVSLIVPSTTGKLLSVKNSTSGSYTLTVKCSSGSGIAIPAGGAVLVYFDGTNVVESFGAVAGTLYIGTGNVLVGGTSVTGLTGTGGLRVFSTTEATASAGAGIIDGGLLVKKAAFINSTTASTSVTTGGLVNAGGFGNGGAIFTNGSVNIQSSTGLPVTTNTGATISYETPITRFYIGDGTGYSLRVAKRASSTTTDIFFVTDVGNVGIGSSPGSSIGLNIQRRVVFLGDDESNPGSRTDVTTKWGQITTPHYTNSEPMIHGFAMYNNSSTNRIYIGGGLTASYNAATDIYFATGANNTTLSGTIRVSITSAGQLNIATSTASTSVTTGSLVNTGGFGNSGAAYIGGLLNVAGAIIGSTQALSGPGAANVTTETTKITSTGVLDAISLADGTNGQTKVVLHDVDGGSFVLTPTTRNGWTSFTSTAAGESITLKFVTTRGWTIIGNYSGTIV
jgi:hypothetical protein